MLFAWGRDTGCVPRAPQSKTQAPRAHQGARVGPRAEGSSSSHCHSSFTSPPAGNHRTPERKEVAVSLLSPVWGSAHHHPGAGRPEQLVQIAKAGSSSPSSWPCVPSLWDWPA